MSRLAKLAQLVLLAQNESHRDLFVGNKTFATRQDQGDKHLPPVYEMRLEPHRSGHPLDKYIGGLPDVQDDNREVLTSHICHGYTPLPSVL